jgi:hypothetical protein
MTSLSKSYAQRLPLVITHAAPPFPRLSDASHHRNPGFVQPAQDGIPYIADIERWAEQDGQRGWREPVIHKTGEPVAVHPVVAGALTA